MSSVMVEEGLQSPGLIAESFKAFIHEELKT
jgi:hypothetical protein